MISVRTFCGLLIAGIWLASACATPGSAPEAAAQATPPVIQGTPSTDASPEVMAFVCMSCHRSENTAMPSLDGWTANAMISTLSHYKHSPTGSSVMHRIARGYEESELRDIALFLAGESGGAIVPSP